MLKKILFIFIGLGILVSCSSRGDNAIVLSLVPGMTKQAVLDTIGKAPIRKSARGKLEKYDYGSFQICFDENGRLYELDNFCSL